MTHEEYRAKPGLSHSGMKDLAVSPLRFWYWHVNPARVERPATAEMVFGSALHCAVLEPKEFNGRYAMVVDEDDFPGCLRTIEDLRGWIRDKGYAPSGTRKDAMIQQALVIDPTVLILDVEKANAEQRNAGKTMVPKEAWLCVAGAAVALRDEPLVNKMLSDGDPEVPFFGEYEGVPIKGCLDWVSPNLILDLKTFSQRDGKSIDRSITDAIFWQTYYQKAYLYSVLRGWPEWKGENVMAFVESSPPHEVRIRSFHPKTGGQPNLYWSRAIVEIRAMCRLYKECWEKFGEKPWRWAQEIRPLEDEEISQLSYL
jgi:hypothetical protein